MQWFIRKILGPLFGVSLFAVALWVLHRELWAYSYHDILAALAAIPAPRILLALFLTIVNYAVMTGYDMLALRHIGRRISLLRTVLASFISYAFSLNIGASVLSGGSVRYHMYSGWGLSTLEVTSVVAFCSVMFFAGLLATAGVLFLCVPLPLPPSLPLPFVSLRAVGALLLAGVGGYLFLGWRRRRPLIFIGWQFPLPGPAMIASQVAISSLDWVLAGAVFFALLPSLPLSAFPMVLGSFLLAQIAGLLSQLPGGLGVFETAILLLLGQALPSGQLFGALLAYRGIYYLLPLATSVTLLGLHEAMARRQDLGRTARLFGRMMTALTPHVLTLTIFIGGVILLLSGATPAVQSRLAWLATMLPLPVIEISHFLGSLAGIGLILLARGLQMRFDAAYLLSLTLLAAGSIFSLVKGFDYEEAIILAGMFALLLPCRKFFYRRASLLNERFTPGWTTAIVLAIGSSFWLGLFSNKHLEYSHELWWRFVLSDDAPRFLRASVGVVGAALFFALARLFRPASPTSHAEDEGVDIEQVRAVVADCRSTTANLALLGDKRFLISESGKSFVMYGVKGRSWVAMGDPVGPESERRELVWRFHDLADRNGGWPVFYEVGRENLHFYLDLGLTLLKLGEEGQVPLADFTMEGSDRREFRHELRKLEREGCSFKILSQEQVAAMLPTLRAISDAWLGTKHAREKGFSLGFFREEYVRQFPAAVVIQGEAVIAFATLWSGAGQMELSIDLMRYDPKAPQGIMDFLFVHLILWGKTKGYQWFNLGMAPLSGLASHASAPLWNRLGTFVFRHGEHFYNFQGLRHYKEKFAPEWQPRYLASPGGLVLPRVVTNIAALVSSGAKGLIVP